MCVIEEKIKVFDLLKNILKANNGEKCIFLYGNADFSGDIKNYIAENSVLIFRFITPALLSADKIDIHAGGHGNPPLQVDLAVLGNCGNINNIDVARLGSIKSVLLNLDNSGGVNYPCKAGKDVQIITCGLKEKDTVIFSSINLDEGNVILDLQRSIKNIYGETLEPFEKQINIPGFALTVKTEDLILALTAMTFCGKL